MKIIQVKNLKNEDVVAYLGKSFRCSVKELLDSNKEAEGGLRMVTIKKIEKNGKEYKITSKLSETSGFAKLSGDLFLLKFSKSDIELLTICG